MLKRVLINLTGMQPEDFDPFRFLFLHAFFIGVFLAFYNALAVSLFVAEYGNEGLPYAYLFGGGIGLVVTNIYSYVQKRKPSRTLVLGTYVLILILMVSYLVIHEMGENAGIFEKYLAFAMFVLYAPVITLVGMEFTGVSGDLFNLRQGKRLLSLVNAGEVSAAILANFSLSYLLTFLGSPYHLLYFSIGGLLCLIFILSLTFSRFKNKFDVQESLDDEQDMMVKGGVFRLLGNKYVLAIGLVMIMSTVGQYFADFGFLGGIKEIAFEKTEAEREAYIITFFGLFFGFSNLAELIMSLVSGRLIKQFGIRFALVIQPLGMLGAIVLALLAGWLMPDIPVLIFLFLALNRLFDEVLRKTVGFPSFRLVYHALPRRIKGGVQTLIEGVVRQLGTVLAALLLIIANLFLTKGESTNLLGFTMAFIPLLVFWVWISNRLAGGYQEKLQDVLLKGKGKRKMTSQDSYGLQEIYKSLNSEDQSIRLAGARVLADISPAGFLKKAPILLKDRDKQVRKEFFLRVVGGYGDAELIASLKMAFRNSRDEVERKGITTLLERLLQSPDTGQKLEKLLDSPHPKDWETLIRHLFLRKSPDYTPVLQRLLRSRNPGLKAGGIILAPAWNHESIRSVFTEAMRSWSEMTACSTVAPEFGMKMLDSLEALLRKEYSYSLHLRILESYANMGPGRPQELLLRRLSFADLGIQIAVIRLLVMNKFTVNPDQSSLIKQKIQAYCGNLTWILASIADLQDKVECQELLFWLKEEELKFREAILHLLGFMYNPDSLGVIRENLSQESSASQNVFALELLDNLLEEEIKRWVLPLFEDIPEAQRVRKMGTQFPQAEMSDYQRLRDIVNRDFLLVNNWLKSLALSLIAKMSNRMPSELPASIFHPSPLIFETAYFALKDRGPGLLPGLLQRIPEANANRLQGLEHQIERQEFLFSKRVLALTQQAPFSKVNSSHTVRMANLMWGIRLEEGLYWELPGKEKRIILVLEGKIELNGRYFQAGEWAVEEINFELRNRKIQAVNEAAILVAEKDELLLCLLDSPRLTRQWISILKVPEWTDLQLDHRTKV